MMQDINIQRRNLHILLFVSNEISAQTTLTLSIDYALHEHFCFKSFDLLDKSSPFTL